MTVFSEADGEIVGGEKCTVVTSAGLGRLLVAYSIRSVGAGDPDTNASGFHWYLGAGGAGGDSTAAALFSFRA
ncbi:uncharacterized protein MELLADRAFT_57105 [Melampsora larici-populina 98AG31]|uniref:Uncharacterized protein n=1 Tax=Melampsora larici-populina (strain 98AG31 / pathotype 3-4-7) TaxID=747676 RepID=F4RY71_MELLP|nr:uncharacterized protein MELLADRAFT_57105 [Melampsora larici-populina 98AG31]EGG02689.1 hypothetical protein MELLADRAFT_57105 [Melampsora larici-populina 98AG31]